MLIVMLFLLLGWCRLFLGARAVLFLGTEKYPDENSYSAFLAEHGG